jgi:hypothetical protein
MRCRIPLFMILGSFLFMYADEPVAINLCPGLIDIVDGLFIDGQLIGSIFKIARDIQAMQFGKHTQQGRVGMYTFDRTPHSIRTLAEVEKGVHEALKSAQSNKERAVAEKRQADLKVLLKTMKQDFKKAVTPFLALARGAKSIMVLLISQSCEDRNRQKSELLNWAYSQEDEMVTFDKSITSFALFDDFCTDLVNFLGDLVHSCPKARAQFEKLKEEYVRKQAANK